MAEKCCCGKIKQKDDKEFCWDCREGYDAHQDFLREQYERDNDLR